MDLTVAAGETVAVVGPSGSGKTTLVSVLGGLLRPTEGELCLDGRAVRVGELPPGTVAWVFQTVNLLSHRSAAANVALGMLAGGAGRREAHAAALPALEAVGLSEHAFRRAGTLSGGEAQRVGIARALVGVPRYVLADEPTGQLDLATSRAVVATLFDARPPSTALVVATHDLELARRCDRILRVVEGRVVPAR
ncbi:MAG: ABC transporter ATP-binding protein [Nitriliruptoraceae bacterium]